MCKRFQTASIADKTAAMRSLSLLKRSTHQGKVATARNAIAAGTYETEEKIDRAVDRLLDIIFLR
jgi:hypothetical protein